MLLLLQFSCYNFSFYYRRGHLGPVVFRFQSDIGSIKEVGKGLRASAFDTIQIRTTSDNLAAAVVQRPVDLAIKLTGANADA